jgi:hypothetical protein
MPTAPGKVEPAPLPSIPLPGDNGGPTLKDPGQ